MAKKDSGPGCLMYLFGIALLASLATYILASDAFNFKTILTYGPSQYFANIIHFHKDYYCRAASPLKIYGDILPMDSLEGGKDKNVVATLREGSVFKLKGYRSKEYVTWVAIKFAKGPEIAYGYFMAPEKIDIPTFWAAFNRLKEKFLESTPEPFSNKYFSEIPALTTENYRSGLESALKTELTRTVKLRSATEPAEKQKIKESKEFEIIDEISSDASIYYCPKSEYKKAQALYDAYLGDGFDTYYLQVLGSHSPGDHLGRQEDLLLRIVDTWYFKGLVLLIVVVLVSYLNGRSQGLLRWLVMRGEKSSDISDNPFFRSAEDDTDVFPSVSESTPEEESTTLDCPEILDLPEDMSVGELKRAFQERFGAPIRVYTTIHTKRLADNDTLLTSLRDAFPPLGHVFIMPRFTVSEIEERFRELGIGVQVMNPDGGLAPNDSEIGMLAQRAGGITTLWQR